MKQSKENGVFLYPLQVDNSIIHVGGRQVDTIVEAWIESSWRYEKKEGRTVVQKDGHNQLAIRFLNLPNADRDIWIKQGASLMGWTAVASGDTTSGKFYVLQRASERQEAILDSFKLER